MKGDGSMLLKGQWYPCASRIISVPEVVSTNLKVTIKGTLWIQEAS